MNLSERLTLIRAALGKKPTPEAVNILSQVYPGQITDPPEKGAAGILEGYSHMPWLRACAGKVACSLAAVEWRLYVTRRGKGAQRKAYRDRTLQRAGYERRKGLLSEHANMDELDEITDHPFLDLLTKGNGYHTGVALRRIESVQLDLVGESGFLKGRSKLTRGDGKKGLLTSLWPIPPTWVQSTPTPDNPFYRVSYRGWNENIPMSEVLWMCDPNPAQPYGRGVGLGQAVSDEAEIDEMAAKTVRQLFFNRAAPDFVIYPKGERAEMGKPEAARFQQDWLDRLQGYWRSWKPYFASREIGIYEFTKDMQALQHIEIRNQERDIILQIWGMPPEKLGILSQSNRATIEASDLIYAKDVLVPRLEFRRDIFQNLLVEEYDDQLILDYVTPVMEDKEFALKVASAAPWAMDGNEWRSIMGLEEKDEFDGVYFVPSLVTPVSADQLVVDAGPPDVGVPNDVPPPDGQFTPKKPVEVVVADSSSTST
jgi:hypothetical protein